MDLPDVNYGKMAADFIKEWGNTIFKKASAASREQINKLKTDLSIGFEDYIADTLKRSSRLKTILYRDLSVDISELYVPTEFVQQGNILDEASFFDHFDEIGRVIISGPAGSGKSVFIKQCVRTLLGRGDQLIPIFIELRHVNVVQSEVSSLLHYALKISLEPFITKFTLESLSYALRSGAFVLILDGFDEINFDRRGQYLAEVMHLAKSWPQLKIVISTRPDDSLTSSDLFSTFHVAPMCKSAALQLVSKLRYDTTARDKFKTALGEKLYESHREFASNPLLLTLMLMTYAQVGDLPTKMHIFYNQAFETLVLKHDVSKSMYTRKTHADLDLEQVRRAFSFFCAVSYFRQQYSFTEHDCETLLAEALEYIELSRPAKDVKLDLIVSFSMLQRDGLFITFTHRLFQEYFAAVYLATEAVDDFFETAQELVLRGASENCAVLLADIAQAKFESEFLAPFANTKLGGLRDIIHQGDIAAFANRYYEGVAPRIGKGLQLGPGTDLRRSVQSIARILEGRMGETARRVAAPDVYTCSPEAIQRAELFFGSLSQFEDVFFQPVSEDNVWLKGTKVYAEMGRVGQFIDELHNLLLRKNARKKAGKGKFAFKKAEEAETSKLSQRFTARTIVEKVDRKSGEAKMVLVEKSILRRVVK